MNDPRYRGLVRRFGLASAAVAGAAGAAGWLYGGWPWAAGLFAGAAAVAADLTFLTAFVYYWVRTASEGRGVWRGVAVLAAKMVVPPAAIVAAAWGFKLPVYGVAAGAAVAATAGAAWLACDLVFIFKGYKDPSGVCKN